MDTDEIRALRESVRALLSRRCDSAAVRAAVETTLGYDDKLWSTLCEQIGVAALAIPEEYGGVGASIAEACSVLAELGRALTPCPMLGSAVLSTYAVLATGNPEACARLLPGMADGSRIAALAWTGADGTWRPDAPAAVVAGACASGRAHYVLDADVADILLVVARCDDGVGLFEVDPRDPGVRIERVSTMDQTRRMTIVELDEATVRRLDRGGYEEALRNVRDLLLVALAAEQVGTAERALELTVEYSQQRHQFGRAIGSFQALKHRMADAYVRLEAARSASWGALRSALSGDPELSTDAAVAKVTSSEALQHIAAEMIQLHGGVAITWEHDAHMYFKRAHSTTHLFGEPEMFIKVLGGRGLDDTVGRGK